MVGEIIAAGVGIVALFIVLIIAIIALAIFVFVFWIIMIVDAATRKFKNETDKIVWILIIVFLQILGAVIYYFVVKKPNKH